MCLRAKSAESFKAVLNEQLGPGEMGTSLDWTTSTGLSGPGKSTALGAWPDLGRLSGEARAAATSALWGYSTALLTRSCQVGTQGGLTWASSLLHVSTRQLFVVAPLSQGSLVHGPQQFSELASKVRFGEAVFQVHVPGSTPVLFCS